MSNNSTRFKNSDHAGLLAFRKIMVPHTHTQNTHRDIHLPSERVAKAFETLLQSLLNFKTMIAPMSERLKH